MPTLVARWTGLPAVGDPAGFRLEDCATRRNPTEAGRKERP